MKNLRNVIMLFAASAAMIACQNNSKTAANAAGTDSAATDTMATDSAVYEGEIPGADAGSVYTLKLANDSTDGFSLHIKYLTDKTPAEDYSGKKFVATKEMDGKDVTVYKFALGKDTTYFKVVNDSVLRMVNNQFEEAATKLSYDLKLKK